MNLGATTWQYWTRVAVPLLRPAFLGASLLLFANAFAAYATAAALVSQGNPIVPLLIRAALTSEVLLGRQNLARPGLPDDRGRGRGHDRVRAAGPAYVEVAAVKPSYTWRVTRVALLLLFGAFFLVPLLAMLDFSTATSGAAGAVRRGSTSSATPTCPRRSSRRCSSRCSPWRACWCCSSPR